MSDLVMAYLEAHDDCQCEPSEFECHYHTALSEYQQLKADKQEAEAERDRLQTEIDKYQSDWVPGWMHKRVVDGNREMREALECILNMTEAEAMQDEARYALTSMQGKPDISKPDTRSEDRTQLVEVLLAHWKERAEKAEAERDRLRDENDALKDVIKGAAIQMDHVRTTLDPEETD